MGGFESGRPSTEMANRWMNVGERWCLSTEMPVWWTEMEILLKKEKKFKEKEKSALISPHLVDMYPADAFSLHWF